MAHGIDDRCVVPDREAKSISNETTFAEDIADREVLRSWLVDLVEQVAQRLRKHDIKGRTVELKVRFADFKTVSRSLTLPAPTNITQELLDAALEPEHIESLLQMITPGLKRIDLTLPRPELISAAVEANVRWSMHHVAHCPQAAKAIEDKRAILVGAIYELDTGRVRFLND